MKSYVITATLLAGLLAAGMPVRAEAPMIGAAAPLGHAVGDSAAKAGGVGAKSSKETSMVKLALYVRLEAKAGQEAALEAFLKSALPLAQGEATTPVWFALKFGPSTFGIFDAFADDAGRQAHLEGSIAKALMAKAGELLAAPPTIEKVDLLAAKVPG